MLGYCIRLRFDGCSGRHNYSQAMRVIFFRNRLTHSLEVAQIAKSIALRLNHQIKQERGSEGGQIDTDLVERQAFLAALHRDGMVRDYPAHIRVKDGSIRLCELSVQIMSLGGQTHNVTVVRDITERRQTEQTLRESEEKFAKAFKARLKE